jgi:hypothetical protein
MRALEVIHRASIYTLLLAVLPAACGYTSGFDLASGGTRKIAVQIAGNQTFRQRLEIPLTHELVRQLPIRTGLIITSHSDADAILEVSINDVLDRTLVIGSTPVLEGGKSELQKLDQIAWPQVGKTELTVSGVRVSGIRCEGDVLYFEVGKAAK